MNKVQHFIQSQSNTCGPTSLANILSIFGKCVYPWEISNTFNTSSKGWNISTFLKAAEHYKLRTNVDHYDLLINSNLNVPLVALIRDHYIVIYKITRKKIYVSDPASGRKVLSFKDFIKLYDSKFIGIQVETGPTFEKEVGSTNSLMIVKDFCRYFYRYRKALPVITSIVIVSLITQLLLPLVSRTIIDKGIATASWDFILILIIGSIILMLANLASRFSQTYIITHIANRIKLLINEDYMHKLLSLKYIFITNLNTGDLIQRVSDNERMQTYISSCLLPSLTSAAIIILYVGMLCYFSVSFLICLIICLTVYYSWSALFLRIRKKLDFSFWKLKSESNKQIIGIKGNILDIKCFGLKERYLNRWRENQANLYQQNSNYLAFSQIQDTGANLILQSKDLIITFLGCKAVLDGQITIGTMFAVQYIIGYINAPIRQIVEFFNQTQLALISIKRIHAFHNNEEDGNKSTSPLFLPKQRDIHLRGLSYRYPNGEYVLSQISIDLEFGKKYGFVGPSGCGKSTILKIIGRFLNSRTGDYYIGSTNIKALEPDRIATVFSACLQDNRLFEGTIIENIVGFTDDYNESYLIKAVETASIRREIESLPDSYNTWISEDSNRFSKGQTQRILIARAIYKKADIYLFDEIGTGLNSAMEENIVKKIDNLLKDKTRIYVSHRIDSLYDCDIIHVINHGYIFDRGTFTELKDRKRLS